MNATTPTASSIRPARVAAARTAGEQRLRETADKLVGTMFYGTLLRQMRASTLKGPYGHGGRGEEVFGAQLDQVLAERAGGARSYSLTEAVVRQLIDQQHRIDRTMLGGPENGRASA
jgi:Rod binding domain-containing protein